MLRIVRLQRLRIVRWPRGLWASAETEDYGAAINEDCGAAKTEDFEADSDCLELESNHGEEGDDEEVDNVEAGTAGQGLAVLDVPVGRALVSIPAGDLGEHVDDRLQSLLDQPVKGLLGQAAGIPVRVATVHHGVEGVADLSGDKVSSAIPTGLHGALGVRLNFHYAVLVGSSCLAAGVTLHPGWFRRHPLESRSHLLSRAGSGDHRGQKQD